MRWMIPALVVLAACGGKEKTIETSTTVTETETEAVYLACLSDAQKAMVGMPLDQARPELPADARIIGPDELVTQEYLPNRVNVNVTADQTITRVWCG